MGIDFLDLVFRCEKEFGIKIDREDIATLARPSPFRTNRFGNDAIDLQVRDLTALIEEILERQQRTSEGSIFDRTKPLIASCLDVSESKITLDSWLIHDLGMS